MIGNSMEKGVVDTAVYILRDDKDDDDALVTFTEQRDNKGVSCVFLEPYFYRQLFSCSKLHAALLKLNPDFHF